MGWELNLIPLRLGQLAPPGYFVQRSGMRWLREDGANCRAGEAIAYCSIGLVPTGAFRQLGSPFPGEGFDLQAVVAPRIAGRIRRSDTSSRGGFLDRIDIFQSWTPDFVVGHLERADHAGVGLPGEEDELELLMLAGRRHGEITEGRQGLLTGWHDRSRAWRTRGEAPPGGLLSLGICELAGVVHGDSSAFLELFETISGPAHVVYSDQQPVVPCARIIIEQVARTEADYQAIAADLMGYLFRASPPAAPADWIFAAALLNQYRQAPLADTYQILSRTDLHRTGPMDAVLLSANAESAVVQRHRRLGYTLLIHGYRMNRTGPTIQGWINTSFEPVTRGLDDITRDYHELMGMIRSDPARLPAHVLVFNRMSSAGDDDVQSYAGFDEPMAATLASIYAKDLNLVLQDLAHEYDVAIVDVDAVAADLGAQRNLPDGVHGSGALHTEVRGEVLHILRGRGVPGFGPALG